MNDSQRLRQPQGEGKSQMVFILKREVDGVRPWHLNNSSQRLADLLTKRQVMQIGRSGYVEHCDECFCNNLVERCRWQIVQQTIFCTQNGEACVLKGPSEQIEVPWRRGISQCHSVDCLNITDRILGWSMACVTDQSRSERPHCSPVAPAGGGSKFRTVYAITHRLVTHLLF